MDPVTYRSRCLNPCDHYFWKSRGYERRPDDWEEILEAEGYWGQDYYDDDGDYDEEDEEYDDDEEEYDDEYEEEEEYVNEEEEEDYDDDDDEEEEEYDEDNDYDETDDFYSEEEWRRKCANDLKARQNNPCDILYWQARGYSERPVNWWDLANSGYNPVENSSPDGAASAPVQLTGGATAAPVPTVAHSNIEGAATALVTNNTGAINRTNTQPVSNVVTRVEGATALPKTNIEGATVANTCTTSAATGAIKRIISKTCDNNSVEGATASNKKERESQSDSDLENVCKICLEKPLDCVLLNCNHFCCCTSCASKLKSCPICRKKIDKILRVFKS